MQDLNQRSPVAARNRLSVKVMLAITSSVLVIALLFVYLVEAGNMRKLHRQLVEQQTLVTEGQAIILAQQMFEDDDEAMFLTLTGIIANPLIVGVSIVFNDEREEFNVGDRSPGMSVSFPVSYFDDESGDLIDLGSVTSYRTESYLKNQARDRIRFQALLIAGILLAIATAVGATIHAFVGRPLARIMHALESAEVGTAPKVDWHSHDEMGIVVDRLNYLHADQQLRMDGLREQLDQSERREFERLGNMANASQEAIVIVQGGEVVDSNSRMHELSGVSRDLIDAGFLKETLSLDIPEIDSLVENSQSTLHRESILHRADKSDVPVEIHFRKIEYGTDLALVIVIRDTTESKEAERAIRHMALHDGLTGLANRRHFMERMDEALLYSERNGARLAVLFIDLDNFKAVNDSHGHPVGDRLLKEVANVINRSKQPNDIAARLGGDEFALIVFDEPPKGEISGTQNTATRNGAEPRSEKFAPQLLAEKIISGITVSGAELSISTRFGASVGYSIVEGGARTEYSKRDELLAQADLALYHIKKTGKNAVARYCPEICKDAVRQQQLARSLPDALENGELSLYFQPQVVCKSRKLVGFESLIRWHSATHGAVEPESILQAADDACMGWELTAWIVSTACQTLSTWPEELRMAINLSASELTQGGLIGHITAELLRYDISASRLEVEITETALIEDQERTQQTLEQLSNAGISIALDDFGTGYSSLSMLLQYPINRIKIDKSFVSRVDSESDEALIAISVIEMAHRLGFSVLAEGVEVEADIERLLGQNCNEIQGYLVSKPLSRENARNYIENYLAINSKAGTESVIANIDQYRKAG